MIIKYFKNGKLHGPLYDVKTKNFVEYPGEGNRNLAAIIIPSLPRLTKADQKRDKIRSEWESEAHEEGESKMKQWNEQSINCQRCGQTLVKTTLAGKEIPMKIFSAMASFDSDEIEAIEAYHALKVSDPNITGVDYMTAKEMSQKI